MIDEYIKQRRLIGEKITPEAYLIRNNYDVYNPKKSKGISKQTIRHVMQKLLDKCAIKVNVLETHGFRKFFTTQLVNARINPEIREMLLGHKIGLTSVYYKPTTEEMLDEYNKVSNDLTINEENRLKRKVEEQENILQTKFKELESIISKIQMKESKLNLS